MSSLGTDAPTIGGINPFTGGGSWITDPLGLFKPPPKIAPPAPAAAPAVMPTADDAAVQAAKRKSLAASAARSGRLSTILSDSSTSNDKLG